jgi:hypothetical protein
MQVQVTVEHLAVVFETRTVGEPNGKTNHLPGYRPGGR